MLTTKCSFSRLYTNLANHLGDIAVSYRDEDETRQIQIKGTARDYHKTLRDARKETTKPVRGLSFILKVPITPRELSNIFQFIQENYQNAMG